MYALKHLLLSALSIKTITAWPSQSFKTVPFTPPTFNVTKSGEALAPGLLFLTTTSPPNPAAVIMTNNGELVWSSEAGTFGNFNLQTLHSTPVLTYWSSPSPPTLGYGYGKVHILDSLYQPMYIISPNLHLVRPVGSDSDIDGHEAYMTDRGTLLVTAYNITEADLTSVNGPANGYALDCLLFEIDVQTQEVLFSWSALQAGIPISDTQMPLGTAGTFENPFDWFHINSIQDVGDRYLVNSRHLWTVYMINAKGEIEWQFKGSTGGDFSLPPDIHFGWGHQARVKDVTPTGMVLHMFDNANASPAFTGVNQTFGVMFQLDVQKKTATVLKRFYDPKETLYAGSQGSFNELCNGNVLMGYGQIPIIKEYGPCGDVRLSIQFGDLNGTQMSYRTFRYNFDTVPATAPAIIAGNGTVYMSWNGATGVTSWDVYEGIHAGKLTYSKAIKNMGFESNTSIRDSTTFVQVVARTKQGVHRKSLVTHVERRVEHGHC